METVLIEYNGIIREEFLYFVLRKVFVFLWKFISLHGEEICLKKISFNLVVSVSPFDEDLCTR